MATLLGRANFDGYNGSHFYLELWYELGEQSIENNTSRFQLLTYVGSTDNYSASGSFTYIYPHSTTTGVIDSSRNCGYYDNIPRNSRVGPGYSDWYTVEHDAQGKGSIYVWADTTNNWSGVGSASAGGTIVFPDIPRASSVVATNAVVGGSSTININRAVDTFKHTLTYSFDGLTGTIASNVDTSYPWVVPTTFYQKLTNTDYTVGKTCTITCETFNGETSMGISTTTINVTVDATSADVKPTVDATIALDSATNTLTGATNRIIKGITDATITISATAKNGSSISSRSVVCGDGKSLTANGTLYDVESGTFVVSATDSRGVSNSTTKTLTLVEYVTLTLNPTFYRTGPTNNTIAVTFTGNYFNDKFGTASSTANTLAVKYRYKLSTASSWSSYANLNNTKSGNTYSNGTNPITLGTSFDYTKSYDFEIVATDKVGSVTRTATVAEGIPIFDWGKTDFQFHVPVKLSSGNTILDYSTVSGDRIKLGSSKYWDTTGIKSGTSLLSNVVSDLTNKTADYTYSTSETAIGKWIDGSTIYRKCFQTTNVGNNFSIAHGITKYGVTVNYMISASISSSTSYASYVGGERAAANYPLYIININETNINCYQSGFNDWQIYIVLEYTKKS